MVRHACRKMAKKMRIMKGKRAFTLAAIVLLTSGCDRIRPSADTAKMERELVPKITAWAKTSESTLKISNVFDADRYQTVCIIPDYNCIDSVNNSATAKVDRYYSSFGKCIPENRFAIMVVRDGSAHAVLVGANDVRFDIPYSGTCVKASRSILRRNPHRADAVPIVSIGEE